MRPFPLPARLSFPLFPGRLCGDCGNQCLFMSLIPCLLAGQLSSVAILWPLCGSYQPFFYGWFSCVLLLKVLIYLDHKDTFF